MSRQREWFGNLADTNSVAIPLNMVSSDKGFRVSVSSGEVAITTEETNLSGEVEQTSTTGSLIFDTPVQTVNLTATGAVEYRVIIL